MNCSEFAQMLDLYIDGELDAQQQAELKRHAAQCGPCAEQLNAAEQLRDILSQMDQDIAVPLPAQAGWRSAVKKEAVRRRMKRIYTAVGAVAAACVLTFGVTAMLQADNGGMPAPEVEGAAVRQVAYVQPDGLSDTAVLEASAAPGMMSAVSLETPYAKRSVFVKDLQAARDYLMDVVSEYDGFMERETGGTKGMEIYLRIPGGNVEDFIRAADAIGTAAEDSFEYDAALDSVGICFVIAVE